MLGLALVYLLGAIGAIGGLFQPLIGLFVYVGFAMLRPQYMWQFAGDLSGLSQLVGIGMLVGWAARGFGGFRFGQGRVIVLLLLGFTAWTAISAFAGIDPPRSFVWVIELAKVVAPFLVGVTMLNSRKLVWLMMWTIVIAHGYISYDMNNWYYIRGFNYVWESGYGFMDNNSFGISLVSAVGPAAALGLVAKKWPERIVAFTCAALIVSTIILTYSRGALLGFAIVGLVAFVVVPKRPLYLSVMLAGALLSARLIGPQVVARFETTFAEEDRRDASAQSRVELWSACWDVATQNPLFGIGPRNFPLVAERYGFNAGKEAHSTWAQSLAEMGFPGTLLLLLFYLVTMVKLIPVAWQPWTLEAWQEAPIAAGVLMSLAGFVVSAQFVTMVGLETPYYVTMIGVVILKLRAVAPVEAPLQIKQEPGSAPWRPAGSLRPPETLWRSGR